MKTSTFLFSTLVAASAMSLTAWAEGTTTIASSDDFSKILSESKTEAKPLNSVGEVVFSSDVTTTSGNKFFYTNTDVAWTASSAVTVDATAGDRFYFMGTGLPTGTTIEGLTAPTSVPTVTLGKDVTLKAPDSSSSDRQLTRVPTSPTANPRVTALPLISLLTGTSTLTVYMYRATPR